MKICRISMPAGKLAEAEPNLADDFRSESLLEFPQDIRLRDLFELVMQRGLEHTHEKDARTQANRSRVRGDEVPDDLFPRIDHFGLLQALMEPELLHEFRQQVTRRFPPVRPDLLHRKATPFGNDSSAKRWGHWSSGGVE